MENALFFFPDISGFTSFVTSTERIHSSHLITELLESVLAENELNLELREVEGDAIFFLRTGAPPSVSELLAQVKRMFLAFHTHLQIIERDNVCQCGACRNASNLTLKFIAHYGTVETTTIAGQRKVTGSDVILAHRLLKSGIPEREYLVFPESYPSSIDSTAESAWAQWQEFETEFEHFGRLRLRYLSCSPLLREVPEVASIPDPTPRGRAKNVRMHIEAPLLLVHAVLIDPESKKAYTPGLKDSVTPTPINRVNSTHTCVFEDFEVHFVTRQNTVQKESITYKETADISAGFSFIADYRLREVEGGTDVLLRVFPQSGEQIGSGGVPAVLRRMKARVLQFAALRGTKSGLQRFKDYCEELAQTEEGRSYRRGDTAG
ncbi:MAG: hypothetical protein C0600_06960 [Ignavibacteria bacterium]|nr:MAG: hypothetical protein C0600_06960 [Ignavibacteria bacterium]